MLLHGWPGDRADYEEVAPLVAAAAEVVAPDLRGFGESDKHQADPAGQYSAAAQARSVAALIEELGLGRPVIAGYDIGSRVAQALAAARPDLVRALVISPPLPGIGDRILSPEAQREFWYQQFHQLDLPAQLIDGQPDAVRAYLRHFWEHWSGPDFDLTGGHLEHLVMAYSPEGAFMASINWYRAGAQRRGQVPRGAAARPRGPDQRCPPPCSGPRTIPCSRRPGRTGSPTSSPTASLIRLAGAGHFTPLERPREFAAAVIAAC